MVVREFKRIKIPLLVSIQKGEQNDSSIASLTDLGAGGVRFTSDASLSAGTNVTVILKLPWRDLPLSLRGKAIRSLNIKGSNSFEIACQFLTLNPGEAEEITKVMNIFEREHRLHQLLDSGK